jgi:hypothetical protein
MRWWLLDGSRIASSSTAIGLARRWRRRSELPRRLLNPATVLYWPKVLRGEIAAAQAEIPKVPEIEARLEAGQATLKAEQDRLGRELSATRNRISRMRVDQSIANYNLAEHLREKPEPAVELRFETANSSFAMKDMHPDAAEAWRRDGSR